MNLHKPLCSLVISLICILLISCGSGGDDSVIPTPDPDPNPPSAAQITHKKIGGYDLDIFTPKNYDANKEYPVIYFNDGQSLFQGGPFEMEILLNSMIEDGLIEEVIMVGIYSDGNRTLNYTPYWDDWMVQNWNLTEPRAMSYTQDLVDEVIPYIDENFGTIQHKSGRTLMGYSLGGLHATWAALRFPEHFSKVAALSPSYWVGNYSIFTESPSTNPDLRIWFDIGTAEWNYYVPFQRLLLSQGFNYGRDAFYYEVDGATHDAFSWKSRVHYPLLAFFGKDENFAPESIEVITEVIPSISSPGTYFLRINPVVTTLNGIKYSLAEAATYSLENPQAGTILSDGRFSFKQEEDLRVKVEYRNLTIFHTINYRLVKAQTGG